MSHDPKPLGGKSSVNRSLFLTVNRPVYAPYREASGLRVGLRFRPERRFPWGVWIAFDLLIGTGFACGGWALAWAVYVFNRGQYHPLVRPALLASLFGYSLGGLSITIDVGRYWNLPYFYIPVTST